MMGEAVLISIQPKWCDLIASGKKTIEIRRTKPKLETPFKCYIYKTKTPLRWNKAHNDVICGRGGRVIGEFVCDGFDEFTPTDIGVKFRRFMALHETGLSLKEMRDYLNGRPGYGWHISSLVIYDKPKKLDEFFLACNKTPGTDCAICCEVGGNHCKRIKRPPQSWCYVEEMEGGAEEYFTDLAVFYKNTANDIFKRDNEGRHASEHIWSAEYQKYLGMQIAMREVLEYFSKFELEGSAQQRPNAPLTLDELYERTDPVFTAIKDFPDGGYWCLCQRGYIIPPSGYGFSAKDRPDWVFYRHKPEEGAQ